MRTETQTFVAYSDARKDVLEPVAGAIALFHLNVGEGGDVPHRVTVEYDTRCTKEGYPTSAVVTTSWRTRDAV